MKVIYINIYNKKAKIVPSAFIQNPSPPPVVRFRTYTSFWFTSNVVIKEYVQIIMSGMSKKIAFWLMAFSLSQRSKIARQ